MKEHNVLGSSRGYIARIMSSYSSVTVDKVRKYFLGTLRFVQLYVDGETGYTVNKKIQDLIKIRKCHRGAAQLDVDHSKKVYSRHRFDD